MSKISITRRIHAPIEYVFQTISDIRNFSRAIPDIKNVEFLSEQKTGVGTRFRETREFNGQDVSTELEVTEYKEDRYVRLVFDTQGTVWDSLFTVSEMDSDSELTLEMKAKPHTLMARITTPLMKRFIRKALIKDMDAVKKYCEK